MDTIYPVNAVAGAPAYSGRMLRQAGSVALAGATTARPLGARSGVRPGTSSATVTATSTTWSCGSFAGVIDAQAAAEAGPYSFAFDAADGGALTAANASNPRVDIVYVQIDDPAESDGTSVPAVRRAYLAGVAAASPVAPAAPARSFVVAQINVPKSGGGSPTVTWVAPIAVAAGGILPIRTKALLDLTAGYKGAYAAVTDDTTTANNGLYKHDGSAWLPDITMGTITSSGGSTVGSAISVDANGIVTATLVVTKTTGTWSSNDQVAMIPAGFRIPAATRIPVVTGTNPYGVGFVLLQTSGAVILGSPATGTSRVEFNVSYKAA